MLSQNSTNILVFLRNPFSCQTTASKKCLESIVKYVQSLHVAPNMEGQFATRGQRSSPVSALQWLSASI